MFVNKTRIKEIAKQLEAGKICYIHRKKGTIKTLEEVADEATASEEWQKEFQALEKDTKHYMKIPRMSALDELNAMKDFLEEEDLSKGVEKELTTALKRKKPMRNFLQVVNSEEGLQQYWLNFKSKWNRTWVENYFIDAYNY